MTHHTLNRDGRISYTEFGKALTGHILKRMQVTGEDYVFPHASEAVSAAAHNSRPPLFTHV